MQEEISDQVGLEQIKGKIHSVDGRKPSFVFLHGSGKGSGLNFPEWISVELLKNDISSLSFYFSGCGESSGLFEKSNLKKRTEEAKTMIEKYADTNNLVVCGVSMGGYIALKMLEYFNVKSLILICPAIYDQAAFNVSFDSGFTEIIRRDQSWKNSDILKNLNKFNGKLQIIIGDLDEVIPSEVIDLIDKASSLVTKKEITFLPDCTHAVFPWFKDHPDQALTIFRYTIQEFVI